jgi:hypothetical protein
VIDSRNNRRRFPANRTSTMQDQANLDPVWKQPLYVWLKSEFLDGDNALRFETVGDEFNGASWPLGLELNPDGRLRPDPRFLVIDLAFDEDVKSAWQLPRLASRKTIDTPERRANANFVITNVGRWNQDARRFDEICHGLGHQLRGHPHFQVRKAYALTPFCIIAQQWMESSDHPDIPEILRNVAEITHTDIVLFYTFETFIQECLAVEARANGFARDVIVGQYQHIYTNSWPPDVIATDPARLALTKLVNPALDWDEVRTTAATADRSTRSRGVPGSLPRTLRENLFRLRLQTHLMVAVAVALRGLKDFADGPTRSSLVRPIESLPNLNSLAPFWLRHVLGAYDHAQECHALLADLAHRYGNDVAFQCMLKEGGFLEPHTAAEYSIAMTPKIGAGTGVLGAEYDVRRWALFDSWIDDESLLTWIDKIRQARQ